MNMNGNRAACGALALMIGIFLPACTIPRYISAQSDYRFTRAKIKDWETPQSQERTIRVLLVHGMDNQPFGVVNHDSYEPQLFGYKTYRSLQSHLDLINTDSDFRGKVVQAAIENSWFKFIHGEAQRLGNTAEDTALESASNYEFHLAYNQSHQPIGYTLTRVFKPNKDGIGLKFYIANWGLGAAVEKEQRFGSWGSLTTDDPQEHGYIEGDVDDFSQDLNANRAWLNKMLKLDTMDWGLGDAAMYLSEAGPELRIPETDAFTEISKDWQPNDRLAIVTNSLGSTITLDALVPLVQDKTQVKALFKAGEAHMNASVIPSRTIFYMFANQYGLLTLGQAQSLKNLNSALASAPVGKDQAVQVYAFTDPNDLLSYPLNPGIGKVTVCNVYVRNKAVSLGIGADPLETHVNYEENRYVHDVMLNGAKNVTVAGPP